MLKKDIIKLFGKYNTVEFCEADPIQFPRRYSGVIDSEISAFITSWISYGNRKSIIKKAGYVDNLFNGSPFCWLYERRYEYFAMNSNESFYRFFKNEDFYKLCNRLRDVILLYGSLEEAVCLYTLTHRCDCVCALCEIFKDINGIPDYSKGSPCKRICMFLRWMCCTNKVDLGKWKSFDKSELIIPLDVHVFNVARSLNITQRRNPDMKSAIEITDYFKKVFPNEPVNGDFVLFGYGIEHKI